MISRDVAYRFDNFAILLKDNRCLSDVHSTLVTSFIFTMSRQVYANAWHWGQFVYQIMHFVTVTFQSRKFQSNKIFKTLIANCLKKGSFNYFNIKYSENREPSVCFYEHDNIISYNMSVYSLYISEEIYIKLLLSASK